jgi:hypothetical protein
VAFHCKPTLEGGILAEDEHPIREDLGPTVQGNEGNQASFGVKSALDYLIREKLLNFADAAEQRPQFAGELPRFLAEAWQIFNQYEIAGYVASLRPKQRKRLRSLLYVRPTRGPATARAGS